MEEQENRSGEANEQQGQDNKIKLVNAKYSDAASSDQRDTEMLLDADKAAAPSYELHTENENRLKKEEQSEAQESAENSQEAQTENQQIADADETAKYGEELGGTTNLSLDQLKKEGSSAGTDESELI
jgi:hypothetical protein